MAKGVKTGGRKAGTPNKSTSEIKELARKHGPEVINGFVKIFRESDNDQARIAAGREILDRAYGKATQPVSGDPDQPFKLVVEWQTGSTA